MTHVKICPMSSPAFGVVSVLGFGHSDGCVEASPGCFNLHFPDDTCGASAFLIKSLVNAVILERGYLRDGEVRHFDGVLRPRSGVLPGRVRVAEEHEGLAQLHSNFTGVTILPLISFHPFPGITYFLFLLSTLTVFPGPIEVEFPSAHPRPSFSGQREKHY